MNVSGGLTVMQKQQQQSEPPAGKKILKKRDFARKAQMKHYTLQQIKCDAECGNIELLPLNLIFTGSPNPIWQISTQTRKKIPFRAIPRCVISIDINNNATSKTTTNRTSNGQLYSGNMVLDVWLGLIHTMLYYTSINGQISACCMCLHIPALCIRVAL